MIATHDVLALIALLDSGDHSVLPILADAMEEAGDPRAVGVRRIIRERKKPRLRLAVRRWTWYQAGRGITLQQYNDEVSENHFVKLKEINSWSGRTISGEEMSISYNSFSEAYLALAQIYSEEKSK